MKKGNAVIFFPNHHLAYSPTTINLYNELDKLYHVEIVAPNPSKFNNQKLEGYIVSYYEDEPPTLYTKIIGILLYILAKLIYFIISKPNPYSYITIKNWLKLKKEFVKRSKNKYDVVVAVDIPFLKIASLYFNKIVFVSLEIIDNLIPLLKSVNKEKIEAVIIQSDERFNYLFEKEKPRKFIIQNSLNNTIEELNINKVNNGIIYSGTFMQSFGAYYFLDFLNIYKNVIKGYIKGAILDKDKERINTQYIDLINNNTLIINNEYMSNDELIKYVSQFMVGICFYDIENIKENRFNYLSAPSGKMFTYIAAGIPIIGSKISGLNIVDDYKCGILIENYSPDTIFNAYQDIINNYQTYSNNCLKASADFNFSKMAIEFMRYLNEK